MTTAERLEAKGRAEGRTEGRAEGRTEGRAEGRAEALLELLTMRFGPVPASVAERVRNSSIDQLQQWTARILTAETLAKIFE
ncbi:DUF4351 domain-containing protein [Nocardia sp. CDC160]|uniref:DUF4351 domain-containing protein n=1 Tax=Nocardia sp. CDC160 TaxID=3112166 RepID=UPI002DB6D9BA|nr:DUF4351 domain-containing protein [Nocardia sp. CDC160]MEC3917460.1 DUF4351 domain-containing protein [Nocardia sp. CDC160]